MAQSTPERTLLRRGIVARRLVPLALVCLLAAAPSGKADLPGDMVAKVKAATAFVDAGDSSGSAFCIDASGLFVTNDHVVEDHLTDGKVSLIINSGEKDQVKLPVTILRIDPDEDLALLKVRATTALSALEIGDVSKLYETLPVTAFGYPFGKLLALKEGDFPSITVTTGRVTALRKLKGELEAIQLDASVNPGNSGGPVVNDHGQVIGIVQAAVAGASGINFAIPANHLSHFLEKPHIVVDVPAIPAGSEAQEQEFKIRVETYVPGKLSVRLAINAPGSPSRGVDATPTTENSFAAKIAPLLTPAGATKPRAIPFQITVKMGDRSLDGMDGWIYPGRAAYSLDSNMTAQVTALTAADAGLQTGSPCPMFRGNVRHTGQSYGSGARGVLRWAFRSSGAIHATAVIGARGTILVGASDGAFHALDGATGQERWHFKAGGYIQSCAAIGANGLIYFGSLDHSVYALNAVDGTMRWSFPTRNEVHSSPAIGRDGTVYIGSIDGSLYALDGATGRQKWSFPTGGPINGAPAIGPDGTVYIGSWDGSIYAVDSGTGKARWEVAADHPVQCSPAIGPDGTVYVGTDGGDIVAIDGDTGDPKWTLDAGAPVDSAPAITLGGTLFVASSNHVLRSVDAATGKEKWARVVGNITWSSPVIGSDSTLYIASDQPDNKLYALDATNGVTRWSFQAGGYFLSTPALGVDGTLYIGCDDHNVYTIR